MRWLVSRGWHGWVLVVIVVVVFDVGATALGGETMTDAMRRWFHQASTLWVVVPLIAYLVLHLTVMPWRVDPLDRTFVWLRHKLHHQPTLTREQIIDQARHQERQH